MNSARKASTSASKESCTQRGYQVLNIYRRVRYD
jgi:hypothetical protein